jgi:hypothetical protein
MLRIRENQEFDKWWNQWISKLLGGRGEVKESRSEERPGIDARITLTRLRPTEFERDKWPDRRK